MLEQTENNELIIIDNQYFGTINYINTLFQFSNIQIEQYESYQKMSFRNRCVVAGSNGPVNLSVPLEKGRGQKVLMKDVRISHSANWRVQHWRIRHNPPCIARGRCWWTSIWPCCALLPPCACRRALPLL